MRNLVSIICASFTAFAGACVSADEPLPFAEPIAEKIQASNIVVDIELFAQMPATGESPLLTRINQMTAVRDGTERLYVNDIRGKIYEVSSGEPKLYMDYIKRVPKLQHKVGLGSGLGSVEFHPDFADNGKFYTVHVEKLDESVLTEEVSEADKVWWSTGVLTEWTDTNPKDEIFTGTSREMLRLALPTAVHGLQQLSFNPTVSKGDPDYGMLYVCFGESGSLQANRTHMLRNLSSPLGCILRIDPLGEGSIIGDYGFPADNPWASDGDPNTLGEIWCMGMRNPHRISWDTGGSGRIFFGDIGEMRVEEVNIAEAGRDYGWPIREGYFRFDPKGLRFEVFALKEEDHIIEPKLTYPVAQYDHREGYAISGGGVYRGKRLPELYGKYLFGDIVSGRLFYIEEEEAQFGSLAPIHEFFLRKDGKSTSLARMSGGGRVDLRFGWDLDGELFIFEKGNGRIYKAVSSGRVSSSDEIGIAGLDLQLNEYSVKADPAMAVVATGKHRIVDDMEDGDLSGIRIEGREGDWTKYTADESGELLVEVVEMDDAPGEGSRVLRVSGSGWEESGSRVLMPLVGAEDGKELLHYDASIYDGIQLWVKTEGRSRLRPSISTVYTVSADRGGLCDGDSYPCENFYRAKWTVKPGWNLMKIPFARFYQPGLPNDGSLDPSILKEIGFEMRDGATYEFWIDDIGFYSEDE